MQTQKHWHDLAAWFLAGALLAASLASLASCGGVGLDEASPTPVVLCNTTPPVCT